MVSVFGQDFETIDTKAGGRWYTVSSYDFTNSNYVKYQVKACKKAYLRIGKYRFHPQFGRDVLVPDFIVPLGLGRNANEGKENYLVTVNPAGGSATNHSLERLLDCNAFVQFYVKWRGPNGLLEFGNKDGPLLTVHDPVYQNRSVSPNVGVSTLDVDGEFRIFNPHLNDNLCCHVAGNKYCLLPDMDCKMFTQQGPASNYLHRCPDGTVFDKTVCCCNWPTSQGCSV